MDGSDWPAVQSPAITFAVIWSTICWYIGRGSLAERKSSGFTVTVLVDYAQYAQLSGRGKSLATGLLGPSPLPPQRLNTKARRVGEECDSKCQYRLSQYHEK